MAKKKMVRRVPQANTPRMYGDGKPSLTSQGVTKAPGTARPASSSGTSFAQRGVENLAREYSYVSGDLKRLAIVAGSLFVFLIVVSFFVR